MRRTYLDAGVLIAAFQGKGSIGVRALEVLDDPSRAFVVSDYLRLEVLPKPTFHRRQEEVAFMQEIFAAAAENISTSVEVTGKALELAVRYDLATVDALHVGAAVIAGVTNLVTTEKPTKPICRVTELKVESISSVV